MDRNSCADQHGSVPPKGGSIEDNVAPQATKETAESEHEVAEKAVPSEGALRPFIIISLSYILFTTTDGAVRMIVLLHAYQQGFSALVLAAIFSGYELAGVIVNILAGVAGSKWGIKATLLGGLTFQLIALGLLYGWQDSWSIGTGIMFITFSQILNGIAKDLTKLGGKTVAKLVTPQEKQVKLFKLVAWITGFKNTFKGIGYLIGALLLTVNYFVSLSVMVVLILAAIPWAAVGLKRELGRSNKKVSLGTVFKMNYNVCVLSIARFFLFASRDLWFEVTLPYFLRSPESGLGWSRTLVGVFLAVWIIVYGQVQSWAPHWILIPLRQSPPNKWVATLWAGLLVSCPLIMASVLLGTTIFGPEGAIAKEVAVITVVLYLFCLIFAINSAVHSYLIVRYSDGDKVASTIGFYYMANAGGRLLGTIMSGVLYTYVGGSIIKGFGACFVTSIAFAALASLVALFLRDDAAGLSCGQCLICVAAQGDMDEGEGIKKEHVMVAVKE